MIKTDNKILDGVSDVQTEVHQDGDDVILNRVQAIGGILEQNKSDHDNYVAPTKDTKDHGMKRIASIPHVIVEKWMKEGINVMNPSENDRVKMMTKLNSSEYRFLRTAPGTY